MSFIDLHVHSNASDGTLTPSEVVSLANTSSLSYIALTDHDTVAGVKEAITTADGTPLTVIPGIEMSCHYYETEIHILGLFIDPDNDTLNHSLDAIVKNRENRNLKMIKKFQDAGIPVTLEKLQAGNTDTIITRAHFARVLIEEGICKNKDQAFNKYLNPDRPFYITREKITPSYGISLIKEAGGLPVLAHPLLYKQGYKVLEEMIDSLIDDGLKGMEVYHSSNNMYESDRLRSIALKKDLVMTGGSDFHGANKPDIKIGRGRGGMRLTEELIFRIADRYPEYKKYL